MKVHVLKTVNPYFEEATQEKKPWELRKNDRDYNAGDYIISREYSAELDKYSNRFMVGEILFILENFPGIEKGYCILTIKYKFITYPDAVGIQLEELGLI
jgi:hypothetical protein